MPIANRQQLIQATTEASRLLQEISDYANDHPDDADFAKVRFPAGFLRTAYYHRQTLSFVADAQLRTNLSYSLMAHDVFRWLITRTTLGLQARDMVIKEAICIVGSVVESITIFPGERGVGRNSSFANRMTRLVDLQVIDQALATELNWVWDIRCREHLMDLNLREWNHYTLDDWRRSVTAYRELLPRLRAWRTAIGR